MVIQPTKRSRQKTDQRDAGELSHLLWVHRQQFLQESIRMDCGASEPPTPQQADDRQFTTLRARLTKKRTAVLNAIHKILRKHNLEQECPDQELPNPQSPQLVSRDGIACHGSFRAGPASAAMGVA